MNLHDIYQPGVNPLCKSRRTRFAFPNRPKADKRLRPFSTRHERIVSTLHSLSEPASLSGKSCAGTPVANSNISPRLEARVRRDYPEAMEEVIAFLRSFSDANAASRQDPERLQAAAFILLEGDVARIPHVLTRVRDWRDGLVWSGLGQPDWPDRLNEMLGPPR